MTKGKTIPHAFDVVTYNQVPTLVKGMDESVVNLPISSVPDQVLVSLLDQADDNDDGEGNDVRRRIRWNIQRELRRKNEK